MVRVVFEHQTIEALSDFIGGAEATTPIPMLVKADYSQQLPLSFAQQRLWFINSIEPDSTQYHMPAALEIDGELNIQTLQQTLNTLLQRHAVLRTVSY